MPVEKTNDWMCAIRAREAARPDAVLSDPYAHLLAGGSDLEVSDRLHRDHGGILLRRCCTDHVLTAAIAGGTRQVVSLGSGWDTRPYLETMPPDLHYYEIDLPGQTLGRDVLLAQAGIESSCLQHPVEADLRSSGWPAVLRQAGHAPDRPTLWIAEGITYYLEPQVLERTVAALSRISAPGSRISFDAFDADFFTSPRTLGLRALVEQAGARFCSTIEDPEALLDCHGWSARAYRSDDIALGRCPWLPNPPRRVLAGADCTWFVQGRKH